MLEIYNKTCWINLISAVREQYKACHRRQAKTLQYYILRDYQIIIAMKLTNS
jgi:hypothetical protein